ncbi:MAG: DUF2769 domain-containing protein [Deltaproteobacteria bacterium]|nr:DUF2769 domain-containing protein [Deltaproteobacteria bacterium]
MVKISEFDNFGVEELSKAEYDKMQAYVTKNCKCQTCPTYVKGDNPYGYCFPMVGTSKLIQREKNCVCESCPIYKEYELTHTFYCTRCSQVCQAYKSEVAAGHE